MSFYNVWQPSSHTGSALTALTTRLLFHLYDFFLVGLWGNVLFYFPRVAGNILYFSCSSVMMNELTWRFAVCVCLCRCSGWVQAHKHTKCLEESRKTSSNVTRAAASSTRCAAVVSRWRSVSHRPHGWILIVSWHLQSSLQRVLKRTLADV